MEPVEPRTSVEDSQPPPPSLGILLVESVPTDDSERSSSVVIPPYVSPIPTTKSKTDQKQRRKRKGCCCRKKKKGGTGGRASQVSNSDDDMLPRSSSIMSGGRLRRSNIPNRPNVSMSLWGVIKNAIGKDLSKLPLPVHFNEPLSMLQRLTEDFEYSNLLDAAADASLSCDQMALVAAFSISSYASTAVRTGKPFNPLLGETYECDRMMDYGFKCFCEQVSHHPPIASQFCTGRKWQCWQEFTMSSRFTGNSIEVIPLGIAHLLFPESGNHYTWRKVNTIVHNIILGSLWIDQQGEMDIFNHTTGDKCHLTYFPTGTFGGNAKKVEGTVSNKQGVALRTLQGHWDKQIEVCSVLGISEKGKLALGSSTLLWSRSPPLSESEKFYFFTLLACQLNEMEDDVPPTDSRRRPDQRLMENGFFEEANLEKVKLEEKQRTARKKREATVKDVTKTKSKSMVSSDHEIEGGDPGYSPKWFTLQKDPITGKPIHIFTGEYWKCKEIQDWSRCPDIY